MTIWPTVVTSPVGAEVTIHCQVLGHPAPFIKWSKQSRSVQTGGKIIIGYVLHGDFINYDCSYCLPVVLVNSFCSQVKKHNTLHFISENV